MSGRKLPRAPRPVTRSLTGKRNEVVFSIPQANRTTPIREEPHHANQPTRVEEHLSNTPSFTFPPPVEVIESTAPETNALKGTELHRTDGAGEASTVTTVSSNPNPNTNPTPEECNIRELKQGIFAT